MLKTFIARITQGFRTAPYRPDTVVMPERFRGVPIVGKNECPNDCKKCSDVCPSGAIMRDNELRIDLGKCLFCCECERACPAGTVRFSRDHRLAVNKRDDLIVRDQYFERAKRLNKELLRLFGRSLKLRQVSAGGCNACELDTNVLNTPVFDLGRFGIQFVASPRHADGLLITGPVTENMRLALEKTYAAVPPPKIVIAVGACAISGGIYAGHPEVHNGAGSSLPVDLYIPGCPPHPWTILDGLLRLTGIITEKQK